MGTEDNEKLTLVRYLTRFLPRPLWHKMLIMKNYYGS